MIIQASHRLDRVQEYWFSRKLQEVNMLEQGGTSVINLGIGNPDLPPSPGTVLALCRQAAQQASHGYQPYRGLSPLRRAMANWYHRIYGVSFNPDSEVLPLIGSKEGIFHISMAFLDPGDKVLVPDPGYAAYASAASMAGATPVPYDLREENGWLPDIEALDAVEGVKIIWLNYPHMPTGALASNRDFGDLIAWAVRKRVLICHDNPYSLVLNEAEPLSIFQAPGAHDCCLELNSLSKSHNMAGWRLGMVSGRSDYISTVLAVKSNVDSGMFLPIQHAGIEALNNPIAWHQDQNHRYRKRREQVYRLLDAMNFSYRMDGAGMFVWAKAPDSIDDVASFLDGILYGTGVFITPGLIFGKNGRRYARVSTCAPAQAISKAAQRIQNYLTSTPQPEPAHV